ncbi:hypothetical protein R6Q57_010651 [Mikania cordata]
MAKSTVTIESAVEVSSEEPGFYGAWYAATVIDEGKPSNKRNRNVNKTSWYLVKYDTLFDEDDPPQPLTEVVDSSFVRPSPPRNIRRSNGGNATEAEEAVEAAEEECDGGGDFEACDVIDAFHRDGWWIGVVKSVIVDGEMRKYIVSFEHPPEEFEFERCNLRLHVDWIDRRWIIPPKKTPEQVLDDRNVLDAAASGFTTPVKRAQINDVGNIIVGPPNSAIKNSRSRKKSESNSVGNSSVTSCRNKRVVKLVEGDSRGKRFQSSAGSKEITKVSACISETRGSDDIHQDSPRVEHEIIITQTHESVGSKSHQKRKRGRTPKLVIEKPIGLQDGHGVTTNIDEQPLSVWYQGMHPLSLKRRSRFSPHDHDGNSPKQAVVASAGTTTNYQHDWPFIKRSPIWSTIESLELYITSPQRPHFSPLKKKNMDYREGLAIAHMITFGNLVQRLPDLRPNDPADMFSNTLETLLDLETHGFDVGPIRARLNELLALKSIVDHHEVKCKEVEKEIENHNHEKSLVEKDMDQLKVKMQELKEKMVQAATAIKVKEGEIRKMQSNLHLVNNQINDLEVAFEKLASTPL